MSITDKLGPFDELRSIEVGEPNVSPAGRQQIAEILVTSHGKDGFKRFPKGFIWDEKTRQGGVATRVANFMQAYYGASLRPRTKTSIGNIADLNIIKGDVIRYDFTHEILTWKPGSFGNLSSCFRTSQNRSPWALAHGDLDHGEPGFTMRLFKPGGNFYGRWRGEGRLWCMPLGERLLVFNAYCRTKGFGIENYAHIITRILGDGYISKEIAVEANGMYTNGNRGILIAKGPTIKTKTLRLKLNTDGSLEKCFSCGNSFLWDGKTAGRNRKLCGDCAHECPVTGEFHPKSEMIRVYGPGKVRGVKLHEGINWLAPSVEDELYACNICGRITPSVAHRCEA